MKHLVTWIYPPRLITETYCRKLKSTFSYTSWTTSCYILQEAEGLCKAFQDSQFEHLLGDYIKSLHDPKVSRCRPNSKHEHTAMLSFLVVKLIWGPCDWLQTKQEAEEYLRELEQDGQWEEVVGNGTVIAVPSPSYVVKTKDASSQRKFFVNICTTDKVTIVEYQWYIWSSIHTNLPIQNEK